MWQQVAFQLLKNYAKHAGLQGVWRTRTKKTKMYKIWCQVLPRLNKALEKVKAFLYAHSVTDADCEHIFGLENSYFQLRQNSVKKQKTMYDFFVKKVGVSD
jgi:hypothetical protein